MNEASIFQVMNPLQKSIEEGEMIIGQIQIASDVLESAIASERQWYAAYRDALNNYEIAETDHLAEVMIQAQNKEGPLGGIAVTGKAYEVILNKLKNDLRRGPLAKLWQAAENTRRQFELAQVDLQQAETKFNALRKVADVKTQVLRASTI